jgi:hypothetical protein
MNRRPFNSLPLGKAITGFVNYKTAKDCLIGPWTPTNGFWNIEENLWGISMSPNSLTTTLIPIWSI